METQNIADSQELPVELSDAAWNSILPFLRDCRNVYVGTPEKCRHFLSAVLWITKEGATWRALPKVYGNWNAIYRRFSRWCDAGGRRTGWKRECRHFLSAVLWITKEGATWRALPKVYGNWNAIYRRFSRWCDAGGRRTGWKLTTLEKNRRADISD